MPTTEKGNSYELVTKRIHLAPFALVVKFAGGIFDDDTPSSK